MYIRNYTNVSQLSGELSVETKDNDLRLDSQRMRMLSEEGDQDDKKRNQLPLSASVTVAKIKITEAVPSVGQKATD